MKSVLASAPILFAAVLLCGPARADITPPEVQPCQTKQAGDACLYNGAGTCQNQTCIKADYAHWDQDASTAPPTTSYACVKCIGGTNTETNTSTGTATNADGGPPPANDSGTCAIGKQATVKRIAPWFLAGAFSLLFLFARRRRQS
jgi:hypothetical protein